MDDTIKRSDAIKAVLQKPAIHGSDGSWYHADDIKDALESVPSADDWIPLNTELIASKYDVLGIHRGGFEPDTFMVVRKGADDDSKRD